VRAADVAAERALAAEALRDAALKEAQSERARADEALAARRELAAALSAGGPPRNGR
jgi:hypothetical protein